MRKMNRRCICCILIILICFMGTSLGETSTVATISGAIAEFESYGHAVLDISFEDFHAAGFELGDVVTVCVNDFHKDMPYLSGYYVDYDEYFLREYPGTEYVAVCINYGSFKDVVDAEVGDTVTITLKTPGGERLLEEFSMLVYSNDRDNFESDEVFANFREVQSGGIAQNTLYRSASPIDDQFCRAATAARLMEAAGINGVLNISDTPEAVEQFLMSDETPTGYYNALYMSGKVFVVPMKLDYRAEYMKDDVQKCFSAMSELDPPYLIHCVEGKDRTGYLIVILQALMGTELEEIEKEFMISFENYYGITKLKEPRKYEWIKETILEVMLKTFLGEDYDKEMDGADVAETTRRTLLDIGMTSDQIQLLCEKLGGNAK